MGWETSDRREHLPSDWNKIRVQVLKRDEGRCTWRLPSGARCPRAATDVDHMGDRDDHRLHKLRSLCRHHHQKVTAKQAFVGRRARRQGRQKRVERHPGLK